MSKFSKTISANIWSISVLVVALLEALFVFNRGIALADDGNMMMAALRVLDGQVPYRDFVHFFYSPGNAYLLSLLYSIFGDSYLIMRAIWALAQAFSVLLVFNISSRFVSKPLSLFPTAIAFFMLGPWFKAFYPFFSLLTFWGISKYLEKPGKSRSSVLGIICAMALFFRQDIGVWASILSFVSVALNRLVWPPKNRHQFWLEESYLVGVAAGILLPFLAYMQYQGALAPMLNELFLKSSTLTSSNWALSIRRLSTLANENSFLFYVYAFHYLTPFLSFLLLRVTNSPIDKKHIVILLCLNILTLFPALVSIGLIRVMQSNHINTILFVVLMHRLALASKRKLEKSEQLRVLQKNMPTAIYAAMFAIPGTYVFDIYKTKGERIVHPLFTSNLITMAEQNLAYDLHGNSILVSEEVRQSISVITDSIAKHTDPDDSVLFLPAQSIFNYLTGHPNPTKLIGVWTHLYQDKKTREEIATLLCSEIDKNDVDVLVLMGGFTPKTLGKSVKRFVEQNFTLVVDYPVRIYKRRGVGI